MSLLLTQGLELLLGLAGICAIVYIATLMDQSDIDDDDHE